LELKQEVGDMKKQYIFVIVGLLILVMIVSIVVTRCASKENTPKYITPEKPRPEVIIEEYLNLKLPATVSVTKFSYPDKDGTFSGKILIDEASVNDIETQISNSFSKLDSEQLDTLPYFTNIYKWWDMKSEDIIYGYFSSYTRHIDENTTTSGERWIFVIQDNEGLYYLYIFNV